MAKKKKDAYYFLHDSNARNDVKILQLRADYDWYGYGLFWGIVEFMREQNDYKLKLSEIKALSTALSHDEGKLLKLVEDCISKYKLFSLSKDKYHSNRLVMDMKRKEDLSSKMRANALQKQNKSKASAHHNSILDNSIEEERRRNGLAEQQQEIPSQKMILPDK